MRDIARVTGTIEFTDGVKVEFGLGMDEDWRNGPDAGRAVDACEDITRALLDGEHYAYGDDEEPVDEDDSDAREERIAYLTMELDDKGDSWGENHPQIRAWSEELRAFRAAEEA